MAEVDPSQLTREELERARDLGAAAYLASYVRLMMRELKINETDTIAINTMAVQMIEPMNLATQAAWRALMEDHEGLEQVLKQFRSSLDNL